MPTETLSPPAADPLAELEANPIYQQLDFGSKARWRAQWLAQLDAAGAA